MLIIFLGNGCGRDLSANRLLIYTLISWDSTLKVVSSRTYFRELCKEITHSLEMLRFLYFNSNEKINQIEFFFFLSFILSLTCQPIRYNHSAKNLQKYKALHALWNENHLLLM